MGQEVRFSKVASSISVATEDMLWSVKDKSSSLERNPVLRFLNKPIVNEYFYGPQMNFSRVGRLTLSALFKHSNFV